MLNAITNHERAEILIQALPYIKRYNGKTIVVKYGGNAMIDDQLKAQVMEDVVLLSLIGVKVVLVHGGGPEISGLMEKGCVFCGRCARSMEICGREDPPCVSIKGRKVFCHLSEAELTGKL